MAAEEKEAEGGGDAPPPKTRSPQLILVLANGVLILAALGVLVYTKLLFERPPLVEEVEIRKKQEELSTPIEPTQRPSVSFDQMMVNIAMTSGKAHWATIAFAVECRNDNIAAIVTQKKALLLDKLIGAMGRRQVTELNTIQGKLLLKTELMREFNAVINQPGGISDLYFSTFLLQ